MPTAGGGVGAVSFTDNPRSEHDSWGGCSTRHLPTSPNAPLSQLTQQGLVSALNAYVAGRAAAMLSPTASSWSLFATLWRLSPAVFGICCGCFRHDNVPGAEPGAKGGNPHGNVAAYLIRRAASAPSDDQLQRSLEALRNVRPQLESCL